MGMEILVQALGANLDHKRLSYKSFPSTFLRSREVTEIKKLQDMKSIPGRRRRVGSCFCHKQQIAHIDSYYKRKKYRVAVVICVTYLLVIYQSFSPLSNMSCYPFSEVCFCWYLCNWEDSFPQLCKIGLLISEQVSSIGLNSWQDLLNREWDY